MYCDSVNEWGAFSGELQYHAMCIAQKDNSVRGACCAGMRWQDLRYLPKLTT